VSRADILATIMCRLSTNCGSHNLLESSRPVQECILISLLLYDSGLERVTWGPSDMDREPESAICFVALLCCYLDRLNSYYLFQWQRTTSYRPNPDNALVITNFDPFLLPRS